MRIKGCIKMALGLLLCLSLILPAAAAGAENQPASGNQEIAALKALGIIKNYGEDGYIPSYAITRGEVAVMALNMMGLDSGVQVGVEQTEEWAAPAMSKVQQMGIMNDGSTEPILYQDLVTVLVRVAGYEVLAQENGGYPAGYLAMGRRAGITDGISMEPEAQVSKSVAASLFYQTATAEMAVQTGFGSEASYDVIKGRTVLSEYRDIYEIYGRLTANEESAIDQMEGCPAGKAEIDHVLYDLGETNAEGLLGYQVQAFYQKQGNDTRMLMLLRPRRNYNQVTAIEAEDLIGFDGSTYTYRTESGGRRSVTISPKADILYNGKPAFELSDGLFIPQEGKVELVAAAGGQIDLVVITDYQTFVVQYYSRESKTLYDKYSQSSIVLDPDDGESIISITDLSGKPVSPSSLKEMDVLTIQKSADKKVIKGRRSNQTVSGMISYVENNEEGGRIQIEGQSYDICSSYLEYGDVELKAGANVKIYLDMNNKVAAAVLQSASLQIGYLAMTAISGQLSETLQLKLFTAKGEFALLKCADSVRIDGLRVKTAEGMLKRLKDHNAGELSQPVQYRTNDEGDVTELDTVYFDEEYESRDSLRLDTSLQSLAYKNNTKIFGNKIAVNDGTVIMNVPKTGDKSDDELYEIKTLGSFANDSSYPVEGYTTKDTYGAVQLLLLYDQSSGSALDKTSSVAVVEDVAQVYDAETGETLDQITCYGSESGSFPLDSTVDASGIQSGDIIRFSTGQGRIKMVEKVYDYATDSRTGAADPGGTATVLGYVYYKDSPYIRVTTKNPMTEEISDSDLLLFKADSFTAFLYDGTGKKAEVTAANVNEMLDYQHAGEDCAKLFIATRNNDPRTMIIIRR